MEQIKGNSLKEQETKCTHMIKSKDDCEIVDVYVDGGKGGENTDRPELLRLKEDAKNGKFDVVAIYKVDRLRSSRMCMMSFLIAKTVNLFYDNSCKVT